MNYTSNVKVHNFDNGKYAERLDMGSPTVGLVESKSLCELGQG